MGLQECNLYKNALVLYQERRASTPLTACHSQNGGHHLVWPQRRVPPSKVLEHLLEEAGWRLVLPPAHEQLTNNATKSGACTPTLTFCSLSPTLCEAPARKPADSLSRSPLRDSPQRPQRSGRLRSTRRPELIARRRRSREKEEVRKKKPNLIADLDF